MKLRSAISSFVLTFGATLLCSTSLLAQKDTQPLISLETTGLYGAQGVFHAKLKSTEIGQPAGLLFGLGDLTVRGSGLVLHINPDAPTSHLYTGVVSPSGTFEVSAPMPNTAFRNKRIWVQAVVETCSGIRVASIPAVIRGETTNSATFSDISNQLPSASATTTGGDVDAVDFDLDGDLDLSIVVEDSSGPTAKLLIYENNSGVLTDVTDSHLPPGDNVRRPSDVEWADFDQDGDMDFLAADAFDPLAGVAEHQLWINDGNNIFAPTNFPVSLEGVSDVAVADIDADCDLDVVMATPGNAHGPSAEKVVLFLNQLTETGLLSFSIDTNFEQAPWNDPNEVMNSVALGDFNQDGSLDLYITRTSVFAGGQKNLILMNDGQGNFTDESATRLPNMFDRSQNSVLADVNGDGALDIVVANSVQNVGPLVSADLLMNNGSGIFTDAPLTSPEIDPAEPDFGIRLSVVAGDVDLDGDIDLVFSIHEFFDQFFNEVGQAVLLVNQGNAQGGTEGEFQRDLNFFAGMPTFVAGDGVLFDLDLDGDLEYYTTSTGGIANPTKIEDQLILNQVP